MNKYELIEKVYFEMKRPAYAAESIVKMNEAHQDDINGIVEKFNTTISEYNKFPTSKEQLKFARDVATILYNPLIDDTKTIIIPAKPGFGKSVFIKIAMKYIIQAQQKLAVREGAIIVSDKYNNLETYKAELGEFAYLMDRRTREPIRDQMGQQAKYPIILITSSMLKVMGSNIEKLNTFTHEEVEFKRTLLLIDEKPNLLDSEVINQSFISNVRDSIDNYPVRNESDRANKDRLRKLLGEVDRKFGELIDLHKDKDFYIYKPSGQLTSDDTTLFELGNNLDFESQTKLKHIGRLMLSEGGLWYNKIWDKSNKQFFRTLGVHNYSNQFKTIIFDATADIDLEYSDLEQYTFLDVEWNKKYDHVYLHNYGEVFLSKSSINDRFGNNKKVDAFVTWFNRTFEKEERNIYLTSFKKCSDALKRKLITGNAWKKVITNDHGDVATYGATKGQNNWEKCQVAVLFGVYTQREDTYTAMLLSFFWMEQFLKAIDEEEIEKTTELFRMTDGKYQFERMNLFRLSKIMVDLEQDLFRCSIRNYNSSERVDIYTFGLNKVGTTYVEYGNTEWTDLVGRLRTRLAMPLANVEHIQDVPEEFNKTLNYGDGNTKVAQLIKWLLHEWDGNEVKVAEVKAKFDIADAYWKKLNKNKDLIKVKKELNIQQRRRGKGNLQYYYWIKA